MTPADINGRLRQLAALVATLPHGSHPSLHLGVDAAAVATLVDAGASVRVHLHSDGQAVDVASVTVTIGAPPECYDGPPVRRVTLTIEAQSPARVTTLGDLAAAREQAT